MPARKMNAVGSGVSDGSGRTCRPIIPARGSGWPQLAMGEWSLDRAEWTDEHPFDEVNYVLEGRLVVDCGGETFEAGPGEVIQVLAGSTAHYHAPEHARMVYVYGPNPSGQESKVMNDTSDGRPSDVGQSGSTER
jgi:mannose-6-phosphate isomerase-like protein (cupin superfamily)